jgi:alcohol dehydrogenase class IV
MAEGIAVEAIRLVKEWLPVAWREGSNIAARSHMMAASTMGATAFQRGLGAMHALAHPLGALYDAHHGLLTGVLMPYVLLANRPAIEPKMARLSRYLDLPDPGFEAVLSWVLGLRREIGIPDNLAELGIDESCLDQISRMAVADPSSTGSPVHFSVDDYAEICRGAVKGQMG